MLDLCATIRVDRQPGTAAVTERLDAADVALLTSPEWKAGTVGHADEGWNWADIVADHPHGSEFKQVKLVYLGRVEGAMILRNAVPFRSAELNASEIVYVTSSPWSRKQLGDAAMSLHPRVTPVGLIMLLVAVRISRDLGHGGRLAWHSEPATEKWYRDHFPGAAEFSRDWDGQRYLTRFEVDGAMTARFARWFVDSGGTDDFGLC